VKNRNKGKNFDVENDNRNMLDSLGKESDDYNVEGGEGVEGEELDESQEQQYLQVDEYKIKCKVGKLVSKKIPFTNREASAVG